MKISFLTTGSAVAFALLCASCTKPAAEDENSALDKQQSAQALFLGALARNCGKAFAGKLVSTDKADEDMADKAMVMHVSKCEPDEIRVPFHVGDNRSRTWVLTNTSDGLRLKHDHRHEDGSEDAVTQYGGDTASVGTKSRQEFPVDAESIALFKKEGLDQSVTNIWAIEVDDALFAYELRREGRFFRVEFDLTTPIETPPPAWGS